MSKDVSPTARIVIGLAVLAGLIGLTFSQSRLDVPYVPTPPDVVERMLDMAQLTKDDFHIDLGSGDGRIVIAAARRGARSRGIDLNPIRIAEANENARKAGVADRVTFVEGNLFEQKISDADVLTMSLVRRQHAAAPAHPQGAAAGIAGGLPRLHHERLGAGPARQRERPQPISLDCPRPRRWPLAGTEWRTHVRARSETDVPKDDRDGHLRG
jgi:hypothetical protein